MPHCDAYGNCDSHCHSFSYSDCHNHSHTYGDSDADAYRYFNPDFHTDCNSHFDSNTHRDADAYRYCLSMGVYRQPQYCSVLSHGDVALRWQGAGRRRYGSTSGDFSISRDRKHGTLRSSHGELDR